MWDNQEGLRVIKTARSEKAIKTSLKKGYWPLVKPVETNPPFIRWFGVYQHSLTGEVKRHGDQRYPLDASWREVIPWKEYTLPLFLNPFAAYLIPADLEPGERVWLEDLIEDLPGAYGVVEARLEASAAIWNGTDFEIDYLQERDCHFTVG